MIGGGVGINRNTSGQRTRRRSRRRCTRKEAQEGIDRREKAMRVKICYETRRGGDRHATAGFGAIPYGRPYTSAWHVTVAE